MVADYRLRCTGPDGVDATWAGYAAFAGVAFVVYPVGIPVFYLYKLYKNKDALYDQEHPKHESFQARYDFLYASYEPQCWYWETVMLMQKLMLTGLLIFIRPGSTTQLAAGFTISLGFLILHTRLQAYVEDEEDDLQSAAMLSITLSLFGGILLKANEADQATPYETATMTGLLIAINAGIVVLFFWQCWMAFGQAKAL